jgi:hypothetical protein
VVKSLQEFLGKAYSHVMEEGICATKGNVPIAIAIATWREK